MCVLLFGVIMSFAYCYDAFGLAPINDGAQGSPDLAPVAYFIYGLLSAFTIGFVGFGYIAGQAINLSYFIIGCGLMLTRNILYALVGGLVGFIGGIVYGRNNYSYPEAISNLAFSLCILGALIGFLIAAIQANRNLRHRLHLSSAHAS